MLHTDPEQTQRISLELLNAILPERAQERCAVCFWDGSVTPAQRSEKFRIHLNAPWALRSAFAPPVGDNTARALVSGAIELTGDLEDAVDAFYESVSKFSLRRSLRVFSLLLQLPSARSSPTAAATSRMQGRVHSPQRDRSAIAYHYDRPSEFYQTFLDSRMVYSCAYFEREGDNLEAAQLAKLDYVLRKVRLRPGQRLLDIGCGWGGLVIRAAEKFGAEAFGVTLSESQHRVATKRIIERGLETRAFVDLRDYRDLIDVEPFDAIVSIGMAEHVGRRRLSAYFTTAYRRLRPGGLFLNHAISDQSDGRRKRKTDAFIARYVFPDGELIPIGEQLEAAERAGFEVRDVENLREHYHRTLQLWNARLLENRAAAVRAGGDESYRVFRTYLAGSALGFSRGKLGIHQSVLAKPTRSGAVDIARTRHELYADAFSGDRLNASAARQG